MKTKTIKSHVKIITITRAEGPSKLCNKKMIFDSFFKANCYTHSTNSFPKYGYDKHDFVVEWENGETYTGRFDAMDKENRYYNNHTISDQIRSVCLSVDDPGAKSILKNCNLSDTKE